MTYTEELTIVINNLITDEISAASMYTEATNYITDIAVSKEIKIHAQEEFKHFTQLMNFATSHNIKIGYDFDRVVMKKVTKNSKQLINTIQKLEKQAIADYKTAVKLAKDNGDTEAEELFEEILLDEISHFDDIAVTTGETRALGDKTEPSKIGSFRNYLKESKNEI